MTDIKEEVRGESCTLHNFIRLS
uniref:Uncharacterized protein n=1 Tax=Tetranychus urticae TaxID=32264 RepID=T1L5L0_TETUR